jgi:phosphopantothenoylcysteine decarboxylase/phosphopantothenate--cysteine ligase
MLSGRRVLVGVCGSIAAYKAAEVVRGLVKDGADVRAAMTPSATKFVGPATFAALSDHPVATDLFAEAERVVHVELGRWAEAYVICGATASTLARLATGQAPDVVSAAYLMARCPILVAPAMHTEMWEHPAVVRNVSAVARDGAVIVPPEEGGLASGDFGVGRLADPAVIVEAVRRALSPADLAGVEVLVTAGPTREPIDAVRFISNRSSGRMGFALATEALRRGARVTLVCGPTALRAPWGADVVRVETAQQMLDACREHVGRSEIVVMNAAVADWRPARRIDGKAAKAEIVGSIPLQPTTDIAAEIGAMKDARILVAFAAETHDVIEHARDKLLSKGADLVVANRVGDAGTGFDSETNDAMLVDATGAEELPRLTKDALAAAVWDRIVEIRNKARGGA